MDRHSQMQRQTHFCSLGFIWFPFYLIAPASNFSKPISSSFSIGRVRFVALSAWHSIEGRQSAERAHSTHTNARSAQFGAQLSSIQRSAQLSFGALHHTARDCLSLFLGDNLSSAVAIFFASGISISPPFPSQSRSSSHTHTDYSLKHWRTLHLNGSTRVFRIELRENIRPGVEFQPIGNLGTSILVTNEP